MSNEIQSQQKREKALVERSIAVTLNINRLIAQLEVDERLRLERKTAEADFMAAQTYRRLLMFTCASILLLLIVLILFFRNLQRNRSYQNILKKARTDAENLAKAKERFVATVSHEIRTPVNAIFGLSEQLLQQVREPILRKDTDTHRHRQTQRHRHTQAQADTRRKGRGKEMSLIYLTATQAL